MRTEKLEMILTHPKFPNHKIKKSQQTSHQSSHPVLFLSTKKLGHLISCGKGLLSSAASNGSPVNCPNLGWHGLISKRESPSENKQKPKNSFRIRVCSISTYWFTTKLEYKSIDKYTSPIDLMSIDCNKLFWCEVLLKRDFWWVWFCHMFHEFSGVIHCTVEKSPTQHDEYTPPKYRNIPKNRGFRTQLPLSLYPPAN